MIDQHLKLAEKQGIEVRYGVRAHTLVYDGNVVRGVKVKVDGAQDEILCKSVVIACGADPRPRVSHAVPVQLPSTFVSAARSSL